MQIGKVFRKVNWVSWTISWEKKKIDVLGTLNTILFLVVVRTGTPRDGELEELGRLIEDAWRSLGRRLDIDEVQLEKIERANNELSERGHGMLKYWKNENGPAATYLVLYHALKHKSVQRAVLAEKFCTIGGKYFLQR